MGAIKSQGTLYSGCLFGSSQKLTLQLYTIWRFPHAIYGYRDTKPPYNVETRVFAESKRETDNVEW